MAIPGPGNSIALRVKSPSDVGAASALAAAVGAAGATLTGLDVVESAQRFLLIDITCNTADAGHASRVEQALEKLDGVSVQSVTDRTFAMHLGGKIGVVPTVALDDRDDLSRAYTPGVARVCLAIAEDPAQARRLTTKGHTVAVVTDGSAVLGLGNIGAAAALPVMEGKAALFKHFGGVDAWPVCLDTQDTEEIIRVVKAIAPSYGGINLEDIAAPRCFEIESRLRAELQIPVFHDDQHGTAVITLAALQNALRVVGKALESARIVIAGAGAAGSAITRLLLAAGAGRIIVYGKEGAVSASEEQPDPTRAWLAAHTNPDEFTGPLPAALAGADVFIGVSAPGILSEEDIAAMAPDAVVFALANPEPEVDPAAAARHAAVVATGRSDFPNQINNVLVFPGFFRGLLDSGAADYSEAMLLAASQAIADRVTPAELSAAYIVPSVFDPGVAPAVAAAVAGAVPRAGAATAEGAAG
ncbi:NAD(P)-dependent malic enzyme [Arthrobacter sp. NPDC055585]